jgi:hypothetical protein
MKSKIIEDNKAVLEKQFADKKGEKLISYFDRLLGGRGIISSNLKEMEEAMLNYSGVEMAKANGAVYGFFIPNYNGAGPRIFLNPEIANNATTLEEVGHLQYNIIESLALNGNEEARRIIDKGNEVFGEIADKWMEVKGEGVGADPTNRFQIIGEKGASKIEEYNNSLNEDKQAFTKFLKYRN